MRARLAVLAALVLVTGCGGSGGPTDPAGSTAAQSTSTPSSPGATSSTPAVDVRAPRLRACYRLDVAAALKLSSGAAPVPCAAGHTSLTVGVGTIRGAGVRLVVDTVAVQRQIARTCQRKVDAWVAGTREARRLSRVQAAWFSPTQEQADAGARWFRCDLVIAGGPTTFTTLPARTRDLLTRTSALNRYATCGTSAPGRPGFRRVTCAQRHTWRAQASIELPAGAAYLSKKAGKRADATCRDIEARRAVTLTRLRWSFEWPTKAQWQNGQRYGLCWTPDG